MCRVSDRQVFATGILLLTILVAMTPMYWGRDKIQTLVCRECGSRMPLVRREPHPALPPGSELRSFECPVCARVQFLSVEMIPQQKAG